MDALRTRSPLVAAAVGSRGRGRLDRREPPGTRGRSSLGIAAALPALFAVGRTRLRGPRSRPRGRRLLRDRRRRRADLPDRPRGHPAGGAVVRGPAVAALGPRLRRPDLGRPPGERVCASDVVDISLWQSFGSGALVAAAAAIGTGARDPARERSRTAQDRAATEEQLRMAQDLHDGVGHGLAVIAMQAGVGAPRARPGSREGAREPRGDPGQQPRVARGAARGARGDRRVPQPRRPASGLADLPALVDRVRAAGVCASDVAGDPGAGAGAGRRGRLRRGAGGAHQRAAARGRQPTASRSSGPATVDRLVRRRAATTGGVARCRMRAWASAGCGARVDGLGRLAARRTASRGGGFEVVAELPL